MGWVVSPLLDFAASSQKSNFHSFWSLTLPRGHVPFVFRVRRDLRKDQTMDLSRGAEHGPRLQSQHGRQCHV